MLLKNSWSKFNEHAGKHQNYLSTQRYSFKMQWKNKKGNEHMNYLINFHQASAFSSKKRKEKKRN